MKTAIITFPGTNREKDMAMALEKASGTKPEIIWHQETEIGNPDLIVLPGGFSYGDYLRCGAMAAHSPIMKEVIRLAKRGTPLLGVCNGFQMLIETGLLPGALLHNNSLKFICKQVHLKCENTATNFTSGFTKDQTIKVPVAHGEGNYFVNDNQLKLLQDTDSIAFRYCDESGAITEESNCNGSVANIAGVFNKDKTILGMMPHPEDATQRWQDNLSGSTLFENIVNAFN